MLIDPDCVVCAGQGLLTLGPAALSVATPTVVAVAVTLALESTARETDRKTSLSDNRTAPLHRVVELLTKAGLITGPGGQARGLHAESHSAGTMARSVTGIAPIELDQILSEAPAFRYTETDRPNARGLPVLSAGGFPSHLARILDPAQAGADTRKVVRARNNTELKAKILLAAAPEAVEIKSKRRKRT
jgi:hypothetical protein